MHGSNAIPPHQQRVLGSPFQSHSPRSAKVAHTTGSDSTIDGDDGADQDMDADGTNDVEDIQENDGEKEDSADDASEESSKRSKAVKKKKGNKLREKKRNTRTAAREKFGRGRTNEQNNMHLDTDAASLAIETVGSDFTLNTTDFPEGLVVRRNTPTFLQTWISPRVNLGLMAEYMYILNSGVSTLVKLEGTDTEGPTEATQPIRYAVRHAEMSLTHMEIALIRLCMQGKGPFEL